MAFNVAIPCPVCSTKIPADTMQLVSGTKFSCPNCSAQVGMSPESAPKAKEAMQALKNMKQKSKNMSHDQV